MSGVRQGAGSSAPYDTQQMSISPQAGRRSASAATGARGRAGRAQPLEEVVQEPIRGGRARGFDSRECLSDHIGFTGFANGSKAPQTHFLMRTVNRAAQPDLSSHAPKPARTGTTDRAKEHCGELSLPVRRSEVRLEISVIKEGMQEV